MLNSIVHEEPVAPVWRTEDLTTNAAALADFTEGLTRGHIEVDLEWAERGVHRRASNRHRDQNRPEHQFEAWQIEAIKKIVEPQSWQIYNRLGYETPDFIG